MSYLGILAFGLLVLVWAFSFEMNYRMHKRLYKRGVENNETK